MVHPVSVRSIGLGGDDQSFRIQCPGPLCLRELDGLEVSTEVGQQASSPPHRAGDFGIGVVPERPLGESDPHAPDPALQVRENVLRDATPGAVVPGVRPRNGRVQQRGVLHSPAQRANRVQALRQGIDPGSADLAHGGLEPRDTAQGCWDADRPARIGAQRGGYEAGSHSDRRPRARASRQVVVRRPRVSGGPMVVIHPGAAVRELDRVGLTHHDHAGGVQALHDGRVVVGDVVGQEGTSRGRREPPDIDQVLHRVGYAVERTDLFAAGEGGVGP